MSNKKTLVRNLIVIVGLFVATRPAISQGGLSPEGVEDDIVYYSIDFFEKYQPNTALDMVQLIPGFSINNGGGQRGFGSSPGNILINDRHPSTKQDPPSGILGRIPASRVDRIELIKATVRNIDLQGHSEVANVVLNENAPAAVRWQTSMGKNFDYDTLSPGGNISVSDRWGDIDFNTGIEIDRFVFGDFSTENIYDGDSRFEEMRHAEGINKGTRGTINFNASSWIGDTFAQLNSEFEFVKRNGASTTFYEPRIDVPSTEFFENEGEERRFEIGIDLERHLQQYLISKLIVLHSANDGESYSSGETLEQGGELTESKFKDSEDFQSESIAQLDFDWRGWDDHTINLNLEGAYNILDNSEFETEVIGGDTEELDVPGTDVRVEEARGNFLLRDIWSTTDIELELAFGAEASRLSQSGDSNQVRRFFFLKPYGVLTYTPALRNQFQLRLGREVSQLNFNDFVSTTEFEEGELSLGNPDLRPETTWYVNLSYEYRFGGEGVIELTGYYRWISDLIDILPLSDTEDARGNIGDGRRWGIFLNGTLPLDRLGLTNAKLDFNLRRRGTRVVDPVTGERRVFSITSFQNLKYFHSLSFRQDLVGARMAWGWSGDLRADRPFFKVNELSVNSQGINLNTFVETTRWLGVKIRLSLNNILDTTETRDRTIYAGKRDLSPVERRQVEKSTEGRRVFLSLNGSF